VVQKFEHVLDILGILDDEVQLHVEFTSHELQKEKEDVIFPIKAKYFLH